MLFFIDKNKNYIELPDQAIPENYPDFTPVIRRPDQFHNWVKNKWVPDAVAKADSNKLDLQFAAKIALSSTSATIERIIEAVSFGVSSLTAPDVVTFMIYRTALRAIVNGSDTTSTVLPTKPPYPTGT